jgi:hypothetical protein
MKRSGCFLACLWAGILFAIGLGHLQPEPVEAATTVPPLQPTLTLVTDTAALSLDPAAAPLVPRAISAAPNGDRVITSVDNFWVHNCDSFSGASGGPLLAQVGEDYGVVALHAGGATDVETQAGLFNYAVKLDAVEARLNNQPFLP